MLGFAKRLVKQAEGIIAPEIAGADTHGFRVLHVADGSPAAAAGLEPLFDYVVAVNGTRFGASAGEYSDAGAHADRSPVFECEAAVIDARGDLELTVWSAKGRDERTLRVATAPAQAVGAALQWTPLAAADNVWHVLHVAPHSPAERAGLRSHADYIVAAEGGLLEAGGETALANVVAQANPTDGVIFYVYNRDHDVVRPVRVFPSAQGKLGCGVGYGLLHALPRPARDASQPGSTVFDEDEAARLSTLAPPVPAPAPAAEEAPVSLTGSPGPLRPRTRHHVQHASSRSRTGQNVAALDDYFSEQSEISRSIDGSAPPAEASSLPPPPKSH